MKIQPEKKLTKIMRAKVQMDYRGFFLQFTFFSCRKGANNIKLLSRNF